LLLDYLKRQKLLRKPVLRAKDTRLLLIRILEKKYYKFLKCGGPANYTVEILSIQPYLYGPYELLFQADIPEDDFQNYNRYKLWGSNEEEKPDREIIQLQWRGIWLRDGRGSFGIDGDYKYYCVTLEPFSGYRDNSECENWFELKQD
jgi:hypothetical protein